MLSLAVTSRAIQRNCNIADAVSARDYAMCTYLLKMRDLYRWEKDYPLTQRLDRADVGAWLAARERLWDELESAQLDCVPLGEQCFDPFDNDAINRELKQHRLVYSAGYGRSGQPQFFLADLDRTELHDGTLVHISSREHARSLSAPPAMSCRECVFVRKDSLERAVWELLEEWQWKRAPGPMADLSAAFSADEDPQSAIEEISRRALPFVIAHELGEAMAGRVLGEDWCDMLAILMGRPAEHWARAVRDHLADCLCTLPALVDADDHVAALFYMAGLRSLRRQLFPSLARALDAWREGASPAALRACIRRGSDHWQRTAKELMTMVLDDPKGSPPRVERWLLERAVL